jgi:hypothetical protein
MGAVMPEIMRLVQMTARDQGNGITLDQVE